MNCMRWLKKFLKFVKKLKQKIYGYLLAIVYTSSHQASLKNVLFPANIYLLKVNNKATRATVKYVQN